MLEKQWSYLHVVELTCVPDTTSSTQWITILYTYDEKGVAQMLWQARCNISNYDARLSTICVWCTSDVRGIVLVCKPSARKRCWEILHQARSPKLLDAQGNEIERPSLIKKRKRNSSFGVERIPKRTRKPLIIELSSRSARSNTLFYLCGFKHGNYSLNLWTRLTDFTSTRLEYSQIKLKSLQKLLSSFIVQVGLLNGFLHYFMHKLLEYILKIPF